MKRVKGWLYGIVDGLSRVDWSGTWGGTFTEIKNLVGFSLLVLLHPLGVFLRCWGVALPGLLIGGAVPAVLYFIIDMPPLIPILPDGWWDAGSYILGYFAWIFLWIGFVLIREGPEVVPESKLPTYGGYRIKAYNPVPFALFVGILGAGIAYLWGVDWRLILVLGVIQLVVGIFLTTQSALGKGFFLRATNYVLLLLAFWSYILTEFSQREIVWQNILAVFGR